VNPRNCKHKFPAVVLLMNIFFTVKRGYFHAINWHLLSSS
jgi:hypothetical protein